MGLEVFGLTMHFVGTQSFDEMQMYLEKWLRIQLQSPKNISGRTGTGDYDDGKHVIEFQLSQNEDHCTLAVRFSLCSYDSIDEPFVEVVKHILTDHEAEVWLMTSALREKNSYPPGELNWLVSALPDEIRAMRQSWQSLFGKKQGKVRVKDSFSFVGFKTT